MAVAAFEAHHLVPVASARRERMITSPLAKLLTAKVVAASVAAFATGGVPLAAGTGVLGGTGSAHVGTGAGQSASAGPQASASTPGALATLGPARLDGTLASRAASDAGASASRPPGLHH